MFHLSVPFITFSGQPLFADAHLSAFLSPVTVTSTLAAEGDSYEDPTAAIPQPWMQIKPHETFQADRLAVSGGELSRWIGGIVGRTPSRDERVSTEDIRKKIVRLLDNFNFFHLRGHSDKRVRAYIEDLRSAVSLMQTHHIQNVVIQTRRLTKEDRRQGLFDARQAPLRPETVTIADIYRSIGYIYHDYLIEDGEMGADAYLTASDLHKIEGRKVKAVYALWRREVLLEKFAEYLKDEKKECAEKVFAAYQKHADAFYRFLCEYLKLSNEERDQMDDYLQLPFFIKEYAKALEKAKRVEDLLNVYGLLAAIFTNDGSEIANAFLQVEKGEMPPPDGISMLVANRAMHDDYDEAYKFMAGRIVLLEDLGRHQQMADEMSALVRTAIEAQKDHHNIVSAFVKKYPQFEDIALRNSALGARAIGHFGCAASYEDELGESLRAKGRHLESAEAFKRAAYDNSMQITSIHQHFGIQINYDVILTIAGQLTKYAEEMIASGTDPKDVRLIKVFLRARTLKEFHEKRGEISLSWDKDGTVVLTPLLGLKELLGVGEEIAVVDRTLHISIDKGRLPK